MLKSDNRRAKLDKVIKDHQYQASSLLEIFHKAQEIYGYIGKDLLIYVAEVLNLPPSHVYGVVAFYTYFRLVEPGENVVTICMGTACYIKGADQIVQAIEKEFNVERGNSTSDGRLSLFTTRCIGACAMAPSLVINEEVIGKVTPESVVEKIKNLLENKKNATA